jgi:[citrate (pro-3S)-lyase] ligase
MEITCGFPFRGAALEALRVFLASQSLEYDAGVSFSACVYDGERLVGTGSLDGAVLKCIAVDPDYQGGGVAAAVVTELVKRAFSQGLRHLFLFTKPSNEDLFASLGFYAIAKTRDALLMENQRDGLARFIASLKNPYRAAPLEAGTVTGAVVANCNPFTRGHQYLIERAASQCAWLHLFILSEDKSEFTAEARRNMAAAGTAHISNVIVQPTGPYLVSGATFPDYFLKKAALSKDITPADVNGALDLALFAERLAPPLGITRRFVGAEPFSPMTARYNALMQEMLPHYGIAVTELPRLEQNGQAISASRVRTLLKAGDLEAARHLTPETTFEYLRNL